MHEKASAERLPVAEEALTQIQHIAYDGTLAIDRRPTGLERGTISENAYGYVRSLEAKLERVCNIAEAGAPDEDWTPPAGAEPEETRGQRALRELASVIGYSENGTGGVDALIDYKNALEDRFLEMTDAAHKIYVIRCGESPTLGVHTSAEALLAAFDEDFRPMLREAISAAEAQPGEPVDIQDGDTLSVHRASPGAGE